MRHTRIAYLLLVALAIVSASITHANERARPISATEFRAILDKERGKVIVLNLWATWCVPCLREVPDLITVANELQGAGVTLIGVAVDDPSPGAAQVESFRKKYFPSFRTFARQGSEIDELASVVDPAWNEVVPTTYIIDRQGKVSKRIQGKRSAEEFRTLIKKSL
jgi:thiol-disulfide isomerase/thioredoxin